MTKQNDELADSVDKLEEQVYGGKFYSLRSSYYQKFITREDLQTIAKYHNGEAVNEEVLNEDVASTIKKVWAKRNDIPEDDVGIFGYYGTYNGCVVVAVGLKRTYFPLVYAPPYTLEIGGVPFTFHYYSSPISVWKIYSE